MGMLRTNWKVVTSEEKSGSLLISFSVGKLYLKEETTGELMTIKYRCAAIGAGKGPPVGASWSNTSDPSGGFDNVAVLSGHSFSTFSFPCHGYILGVGASSGVVGSIMNMDVTGGNVSVVLFGIVPVFAGVKLYGMGRGALPGAGFTGGVAVFEV